ncbi:MAG: hypothetical protein PHE77_00570 [Candidatus Pacebacteria bacterium]|nr:hypothetical protein [Candidatus Paceibacterota bacterium]
MSNDKIRLILITIVSITLFATIILYSFLSVSKREIHAGGLLPILIPLIVIAFMAFFIVRRYKDIKQGMPLEDERSRKVITKASALSFQFSLYWLLAISWFEPFFAKVLFNGEKLDASQTVGGGVAGMAVFFVVFWLYYNQKGQLN